MIGGTIRDVIILVLAAGVVFIVGLTCPAPPLRWAIYALAAFFLWGSLWWIGASHRHYARIFDLGLTIATGRTVSVIPWSGITRIEHIPDAYVLHLMGGGTIRAPHALFTGAGISIMNDIITRFAPV